MSVIFVVIDGTRPDAIAAAQCPNLTCLLNQGAATLNASSVMPSITLPCHMSMFHSVPPSRHGITTNAWTPMARPLPGLIEQAQRAGLRCATAYNWEPLRNLSTPEHLDFAYFRNNSATAQGDHVIAREAVRYLSSERPDFLFVYLGTVDVAGHEHGWMSPGYLAQLERADDALGILLAGLSGEDTILVQSDHGGHDRSHGTDAPEDMTIPWIVAGPRIHGGSTIQSPVSLLDTAPTLARLLGITPHQQWEGCCIDEIFTTTFAPAS